jgi:hypothetical protein
MMRTISTRALLVPPFAVVSASCASQRLTTRTVDDPAGQAIEYGPPANTKFEAEMDAGREYGTITIYKKSTCDVIPVTVMQRYQEKVRGDDVVERTPLNKTQVAGQPDGQVNCDQSYARNVEVLLEADGGRFSLGLTDELGRVDVNLARLFKVASFDEVPSEARVMLRSIKGEPLVEVGQLSLSQLKKHQERVNELLGKLEAILEKGETGASQQEITRSYELYNQLIDLASHDPRVRAIGARFWELFYGRKQEEARERMGRNLDALSRAQATLKAMGDAALPMYVQAAVNSGTLDRQALEWSSLRLLRALRGSPNVCAASFSWSGIPTYGWGNEAQLAAHYVHFAYGPSHAALIQNACRVL